MNSEHIDSLVIACQGMVAKTKNRFAFQRTTEEDRESYLPLWVHAVDTAVVIEHLYSLWLSDGCKDLLIQEAGSPQTLLGVLDFLALTHDIGKATNVMQSKMLDCIPNYKGMELPVSSYTELHYTSDWHHTKTGAKILQERPEAKRILNPGLISVVYAHHGDPKDFLNTLNIFLSIRECKQLYPNEESAERWQQIWDDIIAASIQLSGLGAEKLPCFSQTGLTLLSGLLIMADWIASNEKLFELISVEEWIDDPVAFYTARADEGISRLGLTDPVVFADFDFGEDEFLEEFGFPPNPMQKEAITCLADCIEPGLMIIEAEMGGGKTEAAMAAAQIMGTKGQCGGVYIGMPTQATANGLLRRFATWAENISQDETHSFRLAHGGAQLNTEYKAILEGRSNLDEEDEDTRSSSLICHPWMAGRKQSLLSDFVIGTIDQGLMASLKTKHFMLRLLGMAGKVVIFDEIHSFGSYTDEYICRTLEWLGSYRTPVILLSATLPGGKRKEFVQSYLRGRYDISQEDLGYADLSDQSDEYPLLTYSDGVQVHQRTVSMPTRSREVQICSMKAASVKEELSALIEYRLDDGAMGIVMNTVEQAQDIGRYLLERYGDQYDVLVYHAKYTDAERVRRESQILNRLGKQKTDESDAAYLQRRRRLVVVGTQVLEESLDIDFDLLATQLAPSDLLLQRIGRLHRHDVPERPTSLKQPCCYVIGLKDSALDEGSRNVYAEWLLRCTQALLPEIIHLPEDISSLVQGTYTKPDTRMLNAVGPDLYEAYQRREKTAKVAAHAYLLKKPSLRRIQRATLAGMTSRGKTAPSSGYDAFGVRDGRLPVEVILLQCYNDQYVSLPDDPACWLDRTAPLNADELYAVETSRIKLPFKLTPSDAQQERVIKEIEKNGGSYFLQWRLEHPELKRELYLLLDQTGQCTIAGRRWKYSSRLGFMEVK